METEVEEVKMVLFCSFLFFLLLKFRKKRPRGTFDIIIGFIGSENPEIKIRVNTSLRLTFHHNLELG